MKMKKLPSEANSGRATDSGKEPSGARQPAARLPAGGTRRRAATLGESCEPMDKNRIKGRHGASRWHNTPKATGMPVEVNAAAVQWSNVPLPGEISLSKDGEKSADAIVVEETSRSANEHSKIAGGLTRRRAEPNGGVLTAWRTVVTDNASWRGDAESRHDGKHVGVQDRALARSLHGPRPCLIGTAGYGPVCPVVWDPWLAL